MILNSALTQSSTAPFRSTNQQPFDIDVFRKQDVNRIQAEAFIKQGFKKAYNADISITMPYLLALNRGKFKAVLGIRSAKSPLFIEQYLSTPIEQQATVFSCKIQRNEIAEIGSLYSNAKRFTLPLFLVTAVSLFYLNFKYMVFAGTQRVLKLITEAGVKTCYLAEAKQSCMEKSDDHWGSYYETNPKVVTLSLSDVMKAIDMNPKFNEMFGLLNNQIALTCQHLEGIK